MTSSPRDEYLERKTWRMIRTRCQHGEANKRDCALDLNDHFIASEHKIEETIKVYCRNNILSKDVAYKYQRIFSGGLAMMMRKGLLGNDETLCDFDLRRPSVPTGHSLQRTAVHCEEKERRKVYALTKEFFVAE
jgi:hypothetical protein